MSTAPSQIQQAQLTPFGLVRTTGTPYQLGDLINKYQIDANHWGTSVTGTGDINHVPLMSAIEVLAGGAAGTAILQTHEFWHYNSGCAQRWKLTGFSSDTGNVNSVREWGYGDASDGLFFRHARATAGNYFDIREYSTSGSTSPVTIAQSSWNVDKMDGTGPSGMTLDPRYGNLWEISFEWLGVGDVWYFCNNQLIHVQKHANTYAAPYMRTGQLPTTVRVTEAGGSAGLNGFTMICNSVHSEGGMEPASYGFAYGKPGAPFALAVAETPLLSIRPANTINGIANRTFVIPHHMSVAAGNFGGGADTATFKLYLNSTLTTGLAWTAVGNGSNVERDIGTTAAGFAAGTLIGVTVVSAGGSGGFDVSLDPLFNVRGRKLMRRDYATVTLDILTVTCALNAGTGDGALDLQWNETF